MTSPIRPDQSSDASGSSDLRARLGGIVALITYSLVVNVGLTQWIAIRLDNHPALGTRVLGFYQPFAWIGWQRWYDSASSTFNIAYIVLLMALVLGVTTAVVAIGMKTRSAKRHEALHGTAHWATEDELRKTGLLPVAGKKGAGAYVGGWTNPKTGDLHYLKHNGPEHIAALAPTRSGKGVGLVIPTCLSWPHSIILNDMKAELWNLTAGWRSSEAGNICMKFDPAAEHDSVAFNPLEEIRVGTPNEVGDTQNLVTIIVDPEGKGLVDHWAKTSHAFLTGLVLHELYKATSRSKTATLYDIVFAISDPSREVKELYQEMVDNEHDKHNHYDNAGVHPVIAGAGRDMLNKPDDERGSVLSTAMSFLGLYRDPIVRKNTSRSDFRVMDLMNAEKPVSLYLVVRAEDKDRMKPLMRLILNQIVRVLLRPEIQFVDGRGVAPHKHKLLLMLDEFPSFGRLDIFSEALAYIAGYGIKAYLIMQDIAQLWASYGKDETIISNCHIRIAYAPNKIETAEWLSKMSGTTTVVKEQISASGKRFGGMLDNVTKSFNETSRPLLTPDEAQRLKSPEKGQSDEIIEAGDMLVFVAGHAPIFGTQSLYFKDPTFLERSRIPPPKSARVRNANATSTTIEAQSTAGALTKTQKATMWGEAP